MKRLISLLVVIAMMFATVAVIIPASAANKVNVMGNSNANKQFAGEGNVFYFDYHKYIAAGKTFPMADSDKGNGDYMLRLGNIGGQGTASLCDGVKSDGGFSHNRGDIQINGTTYGHAFGYSFKNSVTVDSVEFYLPTDTAVESIDVYGASKSGSTHGEKTYLGTFAVSSGRAGGALEEALKVDYIFFALKFKSGTSGAYKFYEIELFGLETGAADFSALKTAYARYDALNPIEYEPDSWAGVTAALQTANPVNKSCLSTAAEISSAATALNNAINSLVKISPYKALLSSAIAQAEAIDKNSCSESAYADLELKLAIAKTALATTPFNEATAKPAYDNLKKALDALAVKVNVMGGSNANTQFAGQGNVFYYDYHKYVATVNVFPLSATDRGKEDYMLRLGNNGGSGTASLCDGNKTTGGLTHNTGKTTINQKEYDHAFGYSFKNSVTVDEVKLYLPANTSIASIDVYGAVHSGSTYGKEAEKTYLGTFNVSAGYAGGVLEEAMKVDYIFFALKFTTTPATGTMYKIYEAELFGLDKNAADFSNLKFAYARYKSLKASDYEPATWANVTEALRISNPINKSCLSTAAEIASAANELNNAIDGLVKMSEYKTLLKEAIDQAKAVDSTNCTVDSYVALQAALTAAETVFNAEVFNETAGMNALTTLNNAYAALSFKKNVMGGSNANMQFAGQGNVFYFDYHKYVAAGKTFPMGDSDKGNENFMLRLGNNSGSGTATVCDGVKDSGTFSHNPGNIEINGVTYGHAFGYSFKSSVSVDTVLFYLPTDTNIASIDVYGAVFEDAIYGKDAEKVLLGSYGVGAAAQGAANIRVGGTLSEVSTIDYIFIAVKFKTEAASYKFYEIELFGLEKGCADFSDLKKAIAEFDALSSASYDPASWENALVVRDNAVLVNKNCLSSAAQIAESAKLLRDTIESLVEKKGNKTGLLAEIASTATLVEAEYTPASWSAFVAVLEAARAVADDENAVQSAVDTALANLKAAKAGLVKLGIKTELEAAIAEAEALVESQYTEISWSAFKKALDAAKLVMENASATQEEIDAAVAKLDEEIDDLIKVGDRAGLEEAINAAKDLKSEDYAGNEIAWKMFTNAITAAEQVLNNKDATAKEIEDAIANINKRKELLVSTPGGSATEAPETQAPETQAPETQAPETQAPETQAPETQAPATQAPATQAPETQAPATQAPETMPPVTQLPETQLPDTQLPETQAPETDPAKMKVKAPGACKSTISISALAVVGIVGAAFVVKKKED